MEAVSRTGDQRDGAGPGPAQQCRDGGRSQVGGGQPPKAPSSPQRHHTPHSPPRLCGKQSLPTPEEATKAAIAFEIRAKSGGVSIIKKLFSRELEASSVPLRSQASTVLCPWDTVLNRSEPQLP